MEENKNVSKNGWRRVFGKRWFFPAVYLTMAALLLTGVLWYQNLDNQVPQASDETEQDLDLSGQSMKDFEQDAAEVVNQQEVIKMPVAEDLQTEIVTKFFDYDADSADQEKALVLYDNKYYQSNGLDIASADDKAFDVMASLSGTVTEVKEDPILGNVVKLQHENDLETYYASLGEVMVDQGAKVKQGDTIGTAGRNIYGQASGTHVHFELRKAGEPVNPESYFNQPLNDVKAPKQESADEKAKQEDEKSSTESNATEEKSTEEKSTEKEAKQKDSMKEDQTSGTSTDKDDAEEDDSTDKEQPEEDNTTNQTESSAAMANA
ncbi:M23 family metallopeptidase [Aquibacillus kalidii]|uniref:M23 family metallopeptidase n=1 Tax=Aquibacillus kalidii TaxID=2762597 RepID=UPI00164578DC|nr:M23 family metallopeptidase [Aquibacillus kalidii]